MSTGGDDVPLRDALRAGAALAVQLHSSLATHAGITVTDVSCLGALDKGGDLSIGELALATGLSRGGAITAAVDRLERAGFVRRRRDETDRRKVVIVLVRDGAYARLAHPLDVLSRAYSEIIADFSPAEQEVLLAATERLNTRLSGVLVELRGGEEPTRSP